MHPRPNIPTVDVHVAAERLGGGEPALLVDVREPDEFEVVRVDGAVLLPLSTFLLRYAELPRDTPLLILCAAGSRSAAAAAHLIEHGWSDVTNVAGGIISWERAGLPVRRGRTAPGEGELPG